MLLIRVKLYAGTVLCRYDFFFHREVRILTSGPKEFLENASGPRFLNVCVQGDV